MIIIQILIFFPFFFFLGRWGVRKKGARVYYGIAEGDLLLQCGRLIGYFVC